MKVKKEVLIALIDSLVEDAISSIKAIEGAQGPRGLKGKDGNDFCLEDHKDQILELILNTTPRSINLSEDQVQLLKGEKGEQGRPGRDGIDFIFEDHREEIKNILEGTKLKFSDLTEDEINSLKGADGKEGKAGKDFSFQEYQEEIRNVITGYIKDNSSEFKISFEDLTEDDKSQLRGPRGQRGKAGRDFDIVEATPVIEQAVADSVFGLKNDLKLKFTDLTEEEIDSLKLKFENLTEEDIRSLRGPRGQRGKPGIQGEQGDRGEKGEKGDKGEIGAIGPRGIPGLTGLTGPKGPQGFDGRDGSDGQDAPRVTEISFEKVGKQIFLVFKFSDGEIIETNSIELQTVIQNFYSGMGGGGGGSGTGADGKSAYEIAVENGFVGTEQDWLDSLVGPIGPQGPQGDPGLDGLSAYEVAVENGFIGTEQDWLDSLVGPQGPAGADGADIIFQDEGTPIGTFGTVNFTGAGVTVTEDPAGVLKVDIPGGGGSSCLEVQDEYNLVTTCAQSINFVGPHVRILPRVNMDEWDPLSDVEPSLSEYDGGGNPEKVDVFIDFPDPSIIDNVDCNPDVYVGSFVRMTSGGVAVNALADTFSNSNVIGLVEEKTASNKCVLRVSGRSSNIYSLLDPSLEYYLSDTVPGAAQTTVPTTSGHIRLRLGQPFSSTSFLMSKGERIERL